MFDWRSSASYKQAPWRWQNTGTFVDRFGRTAATGARVRILIDAVANDDHGSREGYFAAGQEFTASQISATNPPMLYIEGEPVNGSWGMCGIYATDVELV